MRGSFAIAACKKLTRGRGSSPDRFFFATRPEFRGWFHKRDSHSQLCAFRPFRQRYYIALLLFFGEPVQHQQLLPATHVRASVKVQQTSVRVHFECVGFLVEGFLR